MALNKAQFFNNAKVKHEHAQRISNLQFSDNSQFIVTISNDLCKVWKIVQNLLGVACSIPGNLEPDLVEEGVLPVAAINNKCTVVAIYRGKLNFVLYEINEQESFKKKDTINLRREIIANGYDEFNYTPGRDRVTEIRFIGGDSPSHLRVYMMIEDKSFVSDVKLVDNVSDWRPQDLY